MNDKKTAIQNFLKSHYVKIIFCSCLVILISPFVLLDKSCACVQVTMEGINVERINDNEISIVQTANAIPGRWNTSRYPYHILVNGHDVSTMDLINYQGLPDTITPPEGLLNQKGSYVNLTGPDFFRYKWGGVHLVIREDFYNESPVFWYNTTI